MKKHHLVNDIDKKHFKERMTQVLIVYTMILMLSSLTYVWLIFIFLKNFTNGMFAPLLFIASILIVFFYFFWKNFKNPYRDFNSGYLVVYEGLLENKNVVTNYAGSGGSLVTLNEYYLTIWEQEYFVKEEDFKKVEIDDNVRLLYSSHSQKLVRVEKINSKK